MVSTTAAAAAPKAKKASAPKKASSHPTFLVMIQEAIKAHPESARAGVSRPAIKKWIASTYKVDFSSAANTNNLSNAIKRGSETGHLSLPKGISGCVKLTPKAKAAGKENVAPKKPAAKKAAAPKKPAAKKTTTKKAADTKKKPAAKKTATTKKPAAKATKAAGTKAPAKKAAPKKKAPAAAAK